MTQAQEHAYGVVTPSLSQLWLVAMLRAFVELVRNVAGFVRMAPSLFSRECDTDVEPQALPGRESGIAERKAAGRSQTTEALMVSRPRSGRPSNHEGGLTDVRFLEADKVGVPGESGNPAITAILVLPSGCSRIAEQALKPALGPGTSP